MGQGGRGGRGWQVPLSVPTRDASQHSLLKRPAWGFLELQDWLCSGAEGSAEGSVNTPENSSLPVVSASWWINTPGPHAWVGQLQSVPETPWR